jgi:hypothetical protein
MYMPPTNLHANLENQSRQTQRMVVAYSAERQVTSKRSPNTFERKSLDPGHFGSREDKRLNTQVRPTGLRETLLESIADPRHYGVEGSV